MAKNGYDQTYENDRLQNEEDKDLIPRAGRMLKAKIDEDMTGGAYTGNRLNVGKDRGSRLGRVSKEDSDMLMKQDMASGMNRNPKMGGMNFKKGGTISKADMQKAGFYDKDKTKSERQKIVSKVTTKPQRVAIVEKAFSTKNMKTGGMASKRADGIAIRGKTRG